MTIFDQKKKVTSNPYSSIWFMNLICYRHIKIISCVGLEPFLRYSRLLTWMLCHPLMFLEI